ncbi:MAG TPA: hypothetical protein VNY09_02155 [Candidatus Sulfotelmatobacter sp.]|jgi:hypothetical protein|nr:hypothetical protein [Candidatus Sulfotelmatobacter sp.]
MKNRLPLRVLFLGIFLAAGCAEGRLYPVRGPYSTQSPVPVFIAKASGIFNSGNISVVLENGEKGKGRWVRAQADPVSTGDSASSRSAATNLTSVWDTVYGQGFYVSHVLGNNLFARAEVNGDRGTTLQMEMYRSAGGSEDSPINIKGVARDNKSNVYKVVF